MVDPDGDKISLDDGGSPLDWLMHPGALAEGRPRAAPDPLVVGRGLDRIAL